MRAAIWYPNKTGVIISEVPKPEPGPGEVLIAPMAVGLCGTDRDIVRGLHPVSEQAVRNGKLEYLIPGHEWSGSVASLGPDVEGFNIGDRVVGEVGIPCAQCQSQRYTTETGQVWCEDSLEIGISRHGALAEYMVIPAQNLHKVPDNLTWTEAALIEPLSVAVHAVGHAIPSHEGNHPSLANLYGSLKGRSVVVWGDGPIGLLIAQVLLLTEPDFLCVVGKSQYKLALAKSLGIPEVIYTGSATFRGARKLVRQILKKPPDVVFEAAGTPEAAKECIEAVKSGGRAVLVGFPGTVSVDLTGIALREVTLCGTRSGDGSWDLAISVASQQRVSLRDMVTSQYSFDEISEVYTILAESQDNVKAIVRVRQ